MIYYTGHAKGRMLLRGISVGMVKSALVKPDKIGFGYNSKSLVFKKFPKGIIKVVFVRKKAHYLVVSVIWELINKS